jgi:hypothetical protein
VNVEERELNLDELKIQKELVALDKKLSRKLFIVNPIIDSCELAVAQGDVTFETVLQLTSEFKEKLTNFSCNMHKNESHKNLEELKFLLELVEELIPLLQLTLQIRNAGSKSVFSNIAFSRLLEASSHLVSGDCMVAFSASKPHYEANIAPTDSKYISIGPNFPVRLYTLFEGSARKNKNDFTWKEDFVRANCSVQRCTTSRSYNLCITEDLNDGRYHEVDENFRKRIIPVSSIKRMFYTCSGKLLGLTESILPVIVLKLILKPETNVKNDATSGVEWIALELYRDTVIIDNQSVSSSDSDDEDVNIEKGVEESPLLEIENLKLTENMPTEASDHEDISLSHLCLLEYMLRLCHLEIREGVAHSAVSDQTLALYFENSARRNAEQDFNIEPPLKSNQPYSPLANKAPRLIDRFLAG